MWASRIFPFVPWLGMLVISHAAPTRDAFVSTILDRYTRYDQAGRADSTRDGRISNGEFSNSLYKQADEQGNNDNQVSRYEFLNYYAREYNLSSELTSIMFDLLNDPGTRDDVIKGNDVSLASFLGRDYASINEYREGLIKWVRQAAERLYGILMTPHVLDSRREPEPRYSTLMGNMDANNDNMITLQEMVGELRQFSPSEQVERGQWVDRNTRRYGANAVISNLAFDYWDRDGDQRITARDLQMAAPFIDRDGDGQYSNGEVVRFVERGYKISSRMAGRPVPDLMMRCPEPWWANQRRFPEINGRRAAMDFDDDFDGWITLRDLERWRDIFDRNGDGSVDNAEYINMATIRHGVNSTLAAAMFELADINGDFRIDDRDWASHFQGGQVVSFCDAYRSILDLARVAEEVYGLPQGSAKRDAMRRKIREDWSQYRQLGLKQRGFQDQGECGRHSACYIGETSRSWAEPGAWLWWGDGLFDGNIDQSRDSFDSWDNRQPFWSSRPGLDGFTGRDMNRQNAPWGINPMPQNRFQTQGWPSFGRPMGFMGPMKREAKDSNTKERKKRDVLSASNTPFFRNYAQMFDSGGRSQNNNDKFAQSNPNTQTSSQSSFAQVPQRAAAPTFQRNENTQQAGVNSGVGNKPTKSNIWNAQSQARAPQSNGATTVPQTAGWNSGSQSIQSGDSGAEPWRRMGSPATFQNKVETEKTESEKKEEKDTDQAGKPKGFPQFLQPQPQPPMWGYPVFVGFDPIWMWGDAFQRAKRDMNIADDQDSIAVTENADEEQKAREKREAESENKKDDHEDLSSQMSNGTDFDWNHMGQPSPMMEPALWNMWMGWMMENAMMHAMMSRSMNDTNTDDENIDFDEFTRQMMEHMQEMAPKLDENDEKENSNSSRTRRETKEPFSDLLHEGNENSKERQKRFWPYSWWSNWQSNDPYLSQYWSRNWNGGWNNGWGRWKREAVSEKANANDEGLKDRQKRFWPSSWWSNWQWSNPYFSQFWSRNRNQWQGDGWNNNWNHMGRWKRDTEREQATTEEADPKDRPKRFWPSSWWSNWQWNKPYFSQYWSRNWNQWESGGWNNNWNSMGRWKRDTESQEHNTGEIGLKDRQKRFWPSSWWSNWQWNDPNFSNNWYSTWNQWQSGGSNNNWNMGRWKRDTVSVQDENTDLKDRQKRFWPSSWWSNSQWNYPNFSNNWWRNWNQWQNRGWNNGWGRWKRDAHSEKATFDDTGLKDRPKRFWPSSWWSNWQRNDPNFSQYWSRNWNQWQGGGWNNNWNFMGRWKRDTERQKQNTGEVGLKDRQKRFWPSSWWSNWQWNNPYLSQYWSKNWNQWQNGGWNDNWSSMGRWKRDTESAEANKDTIDLKDRQKRFWPSSWWSNWQWNSPYFSNYWSRNWNQWQNGGWNNNWNSMGRWKRDTESVQAYTDDADQKDRQKRFWPSSWWSNWQRNNPYFFNYLNQWQQGNGWNNGWGRWKRNAEKEEEKTDNESLKDRQKRFWPSFWRWDDPYFSQYWNQWQGGRWNNYWNYGGRWKRDAETGKTTTESADLKRSQEDQEKRHETYTNFNEGMGKSGSDVWRSATRGTPGQNYRNWQQNDGNKNWQQNDPNRDWQQGGVNRNWQQNEFDRTWQQLGGNSNWQQNDGNRNWQQNDANRNWQQNGGNRNWNQQSGTGRLNVGSRERYNYHNDRWTDGEIPIDKNDMYGSYGNSPFRNQFRSQFSSYPSGNSMTNNNWDRTYRRPFDGYDQFSPRNRFSSGQGPMSWYGPWSANYPNFGNGFSGQPNFGNWDYQWRDMFKRWAFPWVKQDQPRPFDQWLRDIMLARFPRETLNEMGVNSETSEAGDTKESSRQKRSSYYPWYSEQSWDYYPYFQWCQRFWSANQRFYRNAEDDNKNTANQDNESGSQSQTKREAGKSKRWGSSLYNTMPWFCYNFNSGSQRNSLYNNRMKRDTYQKKKDFLKQPRQMPFNDNFYWPAWGEDNSLYKDTEDSCDNWSPTFDPRSPWQGWNLLRSSRQEVKSDVHDTKTEKRNAVPQRCKKQRQSQSFSVPHNNLKDTFSMGLPISDQFMNPFQNTNWLWKRDANKITNNDEAKSLTKRSTDRASRSPWMNGMYGYNTNFPYSWLYNRLMYPSWGMKASNWWWWAWSQQRNRWTPGIYNWWQNWFGRFPRAMKEENSSETDSTEREKRSTDSSSQRDKRYYNNWSGYNDEWNWSSSPYFWGNYWSYYQPWYQNWYNRFHRASTESEQAKDSQVREKRDADLNPQRSRRFFNNWPGWNWNRFPSSYNWHSYQPWYNWYQNWYNRYPRTTSEGQDGQEPQERVKRSADVNSQRSRRFFNNWPGYNVGWNWNGPYFWNNNQPWYNWYQHWYGRFPRTTQEGKDDDKSQIREKRSTDLNSQRNRRFFNSWPGFNNEWNKNNFPYFWGNTWNSYQPWYNWFQNWYGRFPRTATDGQDAEVPKMREKRNVNLNSQRQRRFFNNWSGFNNGWNWNSDPYFWGNHYSQPWYQNWYGRYARTTTEDQDAKAPLVREKRDTGLSPQRSRRFFNNDWNWNRSPYFWGNNWNNYQPWYNWYQNWFGRFPRTAQKNQNDDEPEIREKRDADLKSQRDKRFTNTWYGFNNRNWSRFPYFWRNNWYFRPSWYPWYQNWYSRQPWFNWWQSWFGRYSRQTSDDQSLGDSKEREKRDADATPDRNKRFYFNNQWGMPNYGFNDGWNMNNNWYYRQPWFNSWQNWFGRITRQTGNDQSSEDNKEREKRDVEVSPNRNKRFYFNNQWNWGMPYNGYNNEWNMNNNWYYTQPWFNSWQNWFGRYSRQTNEDQINESDQEREKRDTEASSQRDKRFYFNNNWNSWGMPYNGYNNEWNMNNWNYRQPWFNSWQNWFGRFSRETNDDQSSEGSIERVKRETAASSQRDKRFYFNNKWNSFGMPYNGYNNGWNWNDDWYYKQSWFNSWQNWFGRYSRETNEVQNDKDFQERKKRDTEASSQRDKRFYFNNKWNSFGMPYNGYSNEWYWNNNWNYRQPWFNSWQNWFGRYSRETNDDRVKEDDKNREKREAVASPQRDKRFYFNNWNSWWTPYNRFNNGWNWNNNWYYNHPWFNWWQNWYGRYPRNTEKDQTADNDSSEEIKIRERRSADVDTQRNKRYFFNNWNNRWFSPMQYNGFNNAWNLNKNWYYNQPWLNWWQNWYGRFPRNTAEDGNSAEETVEREKRSADVDPQRNKRYFFKNWNNQWFLPMEYYGWNWNNNWFYVQPWFNWWQNWYSRFPRNSEENESVNTEELEMRAIREDSQ